MDVWSSIEGEWSDTPVQSSDGAVAPREPVWLLDLCVSLVLVRRGAIKGALTYYPEGELKCHCLKRIRASQEE